VPAANALGRWAVNEGIPLPSFDAIHIQEGALYVTNEGSLTTFDLDVPSSAGSLDDATAVTDTISIVSPSGKVGKNNTVGIAGFPEPHARLFGSSFEGVTFYDVSGAKRLEPRRASNFLKGHAQARGLLVTAARGLGVGAFAAPVTPRWLFVPYFRYDDTPAPLNTGGIRIWNVGTAARPTDPQVKLLGSYPMQGTYLDTAGATQSVERAGIGHLAVERLSATELCIWGSYSSKTEPGGLTGLVAFQVLPTTGTPTSISFGPLSIMPRAIVPAYSSAPYPPGNVWYVTVDSDLTDPDVGHIYVALGCGGLAKYEYQKSNPYEITLLAHRMFVRGALVRAVVGPDNGTGGKVLYLALSTGGLGILLDSDDIQNATLLTFSTPLQPLDLVIDPTDSTKRRIFVADARAGIHLYDLTGVF
jgi:hypothetical protein